jgi:uncharacterized damage-inducible protein DinB
MAAATAARIAEWWQAMNIDLNDLLSYTEWERRKWHDALQKDGARGLDISIGPNGDGRMSTVGDLIKHIFLAEKRYVERLTGKTLTEPASIPNSIEALFEFGAQSRREFKHLVETFPAAEWDVQRELKILTYLVRATPRKIVTHTLIHEMRHWSQVGTFLRLNGMPDGFHDFLASPVMGGEFRQED